MRSTVTGLAPGTTGGTSVCTAPQGWALKRRPKPASSQIEISSLSSTFLHGVCVDANTEGRDGQRVRHCAERLLLHLYARLLSHRNGCVNRLRCHAPETALAGELHAVDGEFQALLG